MIQTTRCLYHSNMRTMICRNVFICNNLIFTLGVKWLIKDLSSFLVFTIQNDVSKCLYVNSLLYISPYNYSEFDHYIRHRTIEVQ